MNRRFQLARVVCVPMLLAASPWVIAMGDDDPLLTKVQVDQLEIQGAEGDDPLVLEGQVWVGHDLNKLWLKVDAEGTDEQTEEVEIQALYSRAIAPFWDVQIGVKKDFQPAPDRSWAVIGFQGLAPYLFEMDAALFIGESGRAGFRLNAEYEFLMTQRLILTPEAELNVFAQNDEEVGVGSGISNTEVGLRLRYEIRREFAPYIGVVWHKKYGNTVDYAEAEGETTDDWQWVVGIRAWF